MKGTAILALMLIFFIGLSGMAQADWNPGTSNTKWVQMPDLTTNGVDVWSDYAFPLADDFMCTMTGPITDIHIWGSALNDGNIGQVIITLGIYSNVPVGPGGFSIPGNQLWYKQFIPTDYSRIPYATVPSPGEWFWHPWSGVAGHDTQVFQLNFNINPTEAFVQEKGNVYWLMLWVYPQNAEVPTGWKTSSDHWGDDAVWFDQTNWQELKYFVGHPYEGQSMDLAFAITTVPLPGSIMLLGSGLLGLVGWRRLRKG